MPNNKKNPTEIEASYAAKATDELEEAIAEDLQAEDPDDAEEIIASLEITEEAEEDEDDDDRDEEVAAFESEGGLSASISQVEDVEETKTPIRHRGPQPDGSA